MEQEEEEHRCEGCQYNYTVYGPECNGCRRRLNLNYDTPEELPKYKVLEDKYISVVMAYGTQKLLKRRNK